MIVRAKRLLGFILLGLVTCSAHAGTLLSEDWNSGKISDQTWSVNQTNGSAKVVDVGDGDKALQLDGHAGDFDTAIYSKKAFPRDYLVYCEFKVWHGEAGEKSAGMGFFGPWHKTGSGPCNANIEAGVSGSGDKFVWDENAQASTISSPPALTNNTTDSLDKAFAKATSKATAVTVRVSLGNISGALLEYSTDGGKHWMAGSLFNTGRRAVDSVGQPVGSSWHNLLVGSNKENHIGFGPGASSSGDGHLYIDDVTVYNLYAEHNPAIEYASPNNPSLPIPPYRGQRYQDKIPDTLDLAWRGELTVNAITCGTLRPENDYMSSLFIYLKSSPSLVDNDDAPHPADTHPYNRVKWQESLTLLRMATGSTMNMQVDRIWKDSVVKSLAEGCYINDYIHKKTDELGIGRGLTMMLAYYEHDHNPFWLEAVKKQVDVINRLAVRKTDPAHGDYAYIPYEGGHYDLERLRHASDKNAEMPTKNVGVTTASGRCIAGTASVYLATGYAPALDLSKKFANYVRYKSQYFNGDTGEFYAQKGGCIPFHDHVLALDGMMDYVLASKAAGAMDKDILDFVLRSYKWACNHPFSNARLGFFPAHLNSDSARSKSVETCAVGDMINIARKLARVADDKYWDDVDHYVRNQLMEGQITRTDWIYEMWDFNAGAQPNSKLDRVPIKSLGAYANEGMNADWGLETIACCMGNGSRGLYYAWKDIITYTPEHKELKVNLLLNRASVWADVYSYIPYSGQVDLKIKRDLSSLMVRMPEWVKAGDSAVACEVNGTARKLTWQGKYVSVGEVANGDKVQVTFPISSRTIQESVGREICNVSLRGNTVVSLGKTGTYCPVYQRPNFEGKMPWRTVERWASDEESGAASADD